MLRNSWGRFGVGWDAKISLELDRLVDATQLYNGVGWDSHGMVQYQCMALYLKVYQLKVLYLKVYQLMVPSQWCLWMMPLKQGIPIEEEEDPRDAIAGVMTPEADRAEAPGVAVAVDMAHVDMDVIAQAVVSHLTSIR